MGSQHAAETAWKCRGNGEETAGSRGGAKSNQCSNAAHIIAANIILNAVLSLGWLAHLRDVILVLSRRPATALQLSARSLVPKRLWSKSDR